MLRQKLWPYMNSVLDILSADELAALEPVKTRCKSGTAVLRHGDISARIGFVLSGEVTVSRIDETGSRSIMTSLGPGRMFGEAYAFTGKPLDVWVDATADSELMFIEASAVTASPKLCRRLLAVMSAKLMTLSEKIADISPRTVRARVLSYLTRQSELAGGREFTIAFDRRQLAEYLCVDRTALSAELSRMQSDGLIEFRKNRFRLVNNV